MNRPLLSICIPTYNRAEVLDDSLGKLFSDPDFDAEKIEVVVCDNCSTDDTPQVVAKYPLVRYFRNEENIGDRNFQTVLSHGTGEYLKLMNDTISFRPGFLKKMVARVEEYTDKGMNLMFFGEVYENRNCMKIVDSKASFIKESTHTFTWINNFGIWREDFLRLKDLDKYFELNLQQLDWQLQYVSNGRITVMFFDDAYDVFPVKSKGGFNLFQVFVRNYFYILRENKVPLKTYEIEKYKVFQTVVRHWIYTVLYRKNDNFNFDLSCSKRTLLSHYWYEPYFYRHFLKLLNRVYIKRNTAS